MNQRFAMGVGLVILTLTAALPLSAQEHEHEHEMGGMQEGMGAMHEPQFFTNEAFANFPFSEAVRVGPFLYLSGQIGTDPETRQLVAGGIGPETRQTMENIKATVEKYESSMDRVIKCTVFLADMAEWPAMNEVYATFFPTNKPARSAMGASGLALGARVEIECIAVVG
jgi:reactive intermediate/imine deaminase